MSCYSMDHGSLLHFLLDNEEINGSAGGGGWCRTLNLLRVLITLKLLIFFTLSGRLLDLEAMNLNCISLGLI